MILSFYVLVKILLKSVLVDHDYAQGAVRSSQVKGNYRIIASIFYHTIRDIFLKECPLIRNVPNLEQFDDRINVSRKKEWPFAALQEDLVVTNPPYAKIIEKYNRNKNKDLVSFKVESRVIKKAESKMPDLSPDTKLEGVECLENALYTKDQLGLYYTLAGNNNFDLEVKVREWIEKYFSLVTETNPDNNQ